MSVNQTLNSESVWHPWSPSKAEPWNVSRVAHLHRRAGFGATWEEIQRDLDAGHEASLQRMLNGNASQTSVPKDFESLSELIGNAAAGSENPSRLQAWWLYRMIFSPDPLDERLTLMWHDHFATSNGKVKNLITMRRQNEIFRTYGRGEFSDLLGRVIRDPAILIYLDANSNRRSHPNENLGREMLELFSVGHGNFTESDVTDAARALTGWTVKDDQLFVVGKQHDTGEKTLLGKKGNWTGDDAVKIAVEHPATARRITWRVCEMLFGENTVSETALDELAAQFHEQNMNIGWLVKTALKSKLFFSESNIGNRVRGAVEFMVSTIRTTGAMIPPPSTLALSDWTGQMGQQLFHPPNVFGFSSGREWINSQWLISRTNFVSQLLDGKLHQRPIDLEASFRQTIGEGNSLNTEMLASLFLSGASKTIAEQVSTVEKIKRRSNSETKQTLKAILSLPIANLG